MKRLVLFLTVTFLVLGGGETNAAKKVVSANLTENFVGVSEGFGGAKLTLFGVLKNKADAIVVIKGPVSYAKAWQKTRHFGIWVNGSPEEIGPIPSFYAVASSKPVKDIVSSRVAQDYGFDLGNLPFAQTPMTKGYVGVKVEKGMFRHNPSGVRILESNLFRADISLPRSVPIGLYEASIYEFVSGKLTAMRTENFQVAQVGLNASISRLAKEHAVIYAMLALALSLGIGGGAAYMVWRMS
jgi:uncharacterized protein (TIGR02186 family)